MKVLSIQYILIALLSVQCLLGFTVNLMIVAANFLKWKSLKSLQTCDKILSSLAISRGLYFITILLWNFFFQFLRRVEHVNIALSILYIQTMFIFYSSNWIATILCVFYCVKIVTYNYKRLVFLKTRISTMVPWLILVSLVISLLSSLPFGWYDPEVTLQFFNRSTENKKVYRIVKNFNKHFLIFAVGSFPPFLIFCVANFLLIHFLLMHTRRMRSTGSQIHLESHFTVLKSMTFHLLLQIMFLICMSLFMSGRLTDFQYPVLISRIILCGPPLFHSLYTISSSSEIKKMFILKCLGIFRSS